MIFSPTILSCCDDDYSRDKSTIDLNQLNYQLSKLSK